MLVQKVNFDEVVQKIHKKYELEYPSKCKPNPNSAEGTIIASVFAVDGKKTEILTLSSGAKCLNEVDLKRENVNGRLIHDSHAEILSLRSFNLLVMNHMKRLLGNKDFSFSSENLEQNDIMSQMICFSKPEKRFKWINNKYKLGLYISHCPCGDCSVVAEQNLDKIEYEKWEDDHVKQYIMPENKTLLRGRNNVTKLGFVRSKPGRMDSIPSFSKSCTDKLLQKQLLGINNSLTYDLLDGMEIFLDYLVLPQPETYRKADEIKNCFKRVHSLNPFDVAFTNEKFINSIQTLDGRVKSSTNASGIMILDHESTTGKYIFEGLQDGVKLGYTTKQKKPLRKNCQSRVSRYEMYKLYLSIKEDIDVTKDITRMSYLDFKNSLTEREIALETIRKMMSPDGWIKTHSDNFEII
ncbi:hypothetical protein QEN19_000925 [Hanseniaspora menglaensis]